MSYTVNITWSNNAEHIKAPYIAELWQWDRGVVFNIEGIEDVPNYYQPQFSFVKSNGRLADYAICGATVARTGHVTNPITVSVPNQATDAPGVISFYLAYMESMTSTEIHKTVHVGDILIKKRPRPAGVEPEDGGGSGGGSGGGGTTGTVGYTTPEAFSGTDTQKVQAALDYANTNGVPVVLPKTYRITQTLLLNDSEKITGGGLTYTGTGYLFNGKSSTTNLHGATLENITLTGNGSNSGVVFPNIGGRVINCSFNNFVVGLNIQCRGSDVEGVRIEGNRFINCTRGIYQFTAASATTLETTIVKNIEITGNYFECDSGIEAIKIFQSNIHDNIFNPNGSTGIGVIFAGTHINVNNNNFQTTEAIKINKTVQTEQVQITNNIHMVSADGTFLQVVNEDLTTEISSMLVAQNNAYSGNAANFKFILNGNDTQSKYYIVYNLTNGTSTNVSNCHTVNF